MPGLITHYLCADTCAGTLPENEAGRMIEAHRSLFNIGAQGPDIFFYYVPCMMQRKLFRLGSRMHTEQTGTFIGSLARTAYALPEGRERDAVAAYLYGYLTHYALDCAAHPYIFSRTGFRMEGESAKDAIHRSAKHRNFETLIDVRMLERLYEKKPAEVKIHELVQISRKEAEPVANAISEALRTVYDTELRGRQMVHAMRGIAMTNRLLQSQKGRRKSALAFVERITAGEPVLSSLIHPQTAREDVLNRQKGIWILPWDSEQTSCRTFPELFGNAVDDARRMIEAGQKVLSNTMSVEEWRETVGNRSYETGEKQ